MNTPAGPRSDQPDQSGHTDRRWPALLAPWSGHVPVIVELALYRWHDLYSQAINLPHRTAAEHAVRAQRLAVLCDRRARWWDVLAAWTYHRADYSVPFVYAHAAQRCATTDRDSARFWRETAADWTARAQGRPTSDAAGALSNHHELGIAS